MTTMLAFRVGGSSHSAVFNATTCDPGMELGTTDRARDAVMEMLEQTPTLFGRLEILSNLQNTSDENLPMPEELSCTRREFRRAVELSHLELLYQWLSRSWELRLADTRIHFNRLGGEPNRLVSRALETESYRRLVPPQADQSHRDHFLMDIHALLCLVIGSFD